MGIRFATAGIAVLASAGLVVSGCTSSGSESAESSPTAGATSESAASPTASPTEPCELAPDTKLTDLTYEELQQYELNNGEAIPTLAEFLAFANENEVGVLPEIKTFPPAEGQPKPEPSEEQFEDFIKLVDQNPDISEVLIGSFDESTLKYFADNEPDWPRVWFRGIGGSTGDPFAPPTVEEMTTRAPSAQALGLLNVLYFQGTFPQNGQQYDVPAEFAEADIPIYIWYNVATGGDSADDGAEFAGIPSPGWQSIASVTPQNVTWIATDFTKEYSAWAESAPAEANPIPQMVAHRGGGEESVSENSIQAFQDAVDNGAAVLETDVQWTKPTADSPVGVPVLMHDATVNRTAVCRS
jgi:glycerophosphoryl diester phosphodiesterase